MIRSEIGRDRDPFLRLETVCDTSKTHAHLKFEPCSDHTDNWPVHQQLFLPYFQWERAPPCQWWVMQMGSDSQDYDNEDVDDDGFCTSNSDDDRSMLLVSFFSSTTDAPPIAPGADFQSLPHRSTPSTARAWHAELVMELQMQDGSSNWPDFSSLFLHKSTFLAHIIVALHSILELQSLP